MTGGGDRRCLQTYSELGPSTGTLRHLRASADAADDVRLFKHTGAVNDVAIARAPIALRNSSASSSDGDGDAAAENAILIATAGRDKVVALWDSRTGECVHVLRGHKANVACVAFSPCGTYVASAGNDKVVMVWAVDTGEPFFTFEESHTKNITAIDFSPRGTFIVTGADDGTVRVWDMATKEESFPTATDESNGGPRAYEDAASISPDANLYLAKQHGSQVTAVSFSPCGSWIASGSKDSTIKVWETYSGALTRTITSPSPVLSVSFSPDGATVACGSTDAVLRVWDIHTEHVMAELTGHTNNVTAVAFTKRMSGLILTGSADATARLWDAVSGKCIQVFRGHGSFVGGVAISACGTFFATASLDKTARMWSLQTDLHSNVFMSSTSKIRGMSIIPVTTGSKNARDFDQHSTFSKSVPTDLSPTTSTSTACAHGHCEASTVETPALVAKDETVTTFSSVPKGSSSPVSVKRHPSHVPDALLITSGTKKHLEVASLFYASREYAPDGKRHLLEGHAGDVYAVAYAPQQRAIISAGQDKTCIVWSIDSKQELGCFTGHTAAIVSLDTFRVRSPAQPDANVPEGFTELVVSGGYDTLVRVWNAATLEEVWSLAGHEKAVSCVTAVVSSHDPIASNAHAAAKPSPKALSRLQSLASNAQALEDEGFSLSPLVASGSFDGTARVWDVSTGKCVHILNGGHRGKITAVQSSPDGKLLVTGGQYGGLCVWDLRTGDVLTQTPAAICGHTAAVNSICFTPDGASIVSGSDDCTVRFWAFSAPLSNMHAQSKTNKHSHFVSPDDFIPLTELARLHYASPVMATVMTGDSKLHVSSGSHVISHLLDGLIGSVCPLLANDGDQQAQQKGKRSAAQMPASPSAHDDGVDDEHHLSLFSHFVPSWYLHHLVDHNALDLLVKTIQRNPASLGVLERLAASMPYSNQLAMQHITGTIATTSFGASSALVKQAFPTLSGPRPLLKRLYELGNAATLEQLLAVRSPIPHLAHAASLLSSIVSVTLPCQTQAFSAVLSYLSRCVREGRRVGGLRALPSSSCTALLTASRGSFDEDVFDVSTGSLMMEALTAPAAAAAKLSGLVLPHYKEGVFHVLAFALRVATLRPAVVAFLRATPLLPAHSVVGLRFEDGTARFTDTLITAGSHTISPRELWAIQKEQHKLPTRGEKDFSLNTVTPFPGLASSGLMEAIVDEEETDLFDTVIVRALMDFKWAVARARYVRDMLIYLLFLALLFAFLIFAQRLETFSIFESQSTTRDIGFILCILSTILYPAWSLIVELRKMAGVGVVRYLTDFWHLLALAHIGFGLASGVLFLTNSRTGFYAVLSVALYLRWFGVLYFFQAFTHTGHLIRMIFQMVKDIRFFLLVLCVAVFATASAFFALVPREAGSAVSVTTVTSEIYRSLFEMFNVLILNGSYEAFDLVAGTYSWLKVVFFVITMVLVPIVLLNLLIAIMSDSYESIQDKAVVELYRLRALIMREQLHRVRLPTSCMTDSLEDSGSRRSDVHSKQRQAKQIGPTYIHVMLPRSSTGGHAADGNIASYGGSETYQGVLHEIKKHITAAIAPLTSQRTTDASVASTSVAPARNSGAASDPLFSGHVHSRSGSARTHAILHDHELKLDNLMETVAQLQGDVASTHTLLTEIKAALVTHQQQQQQQ